MRDPRREIEPDAGSRKKIGPDSQEGRLGQILGALIYVKLRRGIQEGRLGQMLDPEGRLGQILGTLIYVKLRRGIQEGRLGQILGALIYVKLRRGIQEAVWLLLSGSSGVTEGDQNTNGFKPDPFLVHPGPWSFRYGSETFRAEPSSSHFSDF